MRWSDLFAHKDFKLLKERKGQQVHHWVRPTGLKHYITHAYTLKPTYQAKAIQLPPLFFPLFGQSCHVVLLLYVCGADTVDGGHKERIVNAFLSFLVSLPTPPFSIPSSRAFPFSFSNKQPSPNCLLSILFIDVVFCATTLFFIPVVHGRDRLCAFAPLFSTP